MVDYSRREWSPAYGNKDEESAPETSGNARRVDEPLPGGVGPVPLNLSIIAT
jgi:hypothetical protein